MSSGEVDASPTQPQVESPAKSRSNNPRSRDPDPSPTAVVLQNYTETKECEEAAAAEAATPKEENESDLLWYFAIGSMMNPTSMNLRNLFPHQSRPGILYGWKLVFRGGGGMGDIDPGTPEDNFHGVLHQVTRAEFKHLDSIEASYNRIPVKVTCYDGTVIDAGAYKMDQKRLDPTIPNALPGERYLDIIIRGAIHYGVKEEYIEKLRNIPVQPRKKPEEYRLIPTPPDVEISKATLVAGTGGEGKDLLISIHGKVLRFAADPKSSPALQFQYDWSKNRFAGQEATVTIAKTVYEPLFPIPTTYESMSLQARLWAEDLFYGFTRAQFPPTEQYRMGNWEVIGWLEGLRDGR